jgi:hypothetical protein
VVECEDGREVELLPETAVETVFAAGDAELARAVFAGGLSGEDVRRGVWLGCARDFGRAIGMEVLRSLVEEAGRTQPEVQVFPATPAQYWSWRNRLRRTAAAVLTDLRRRS